MSVLVQIRRRSTKADSPEVREEYAALCQTCGACCSYYAYSVKGVPADGVIIEDQRYTFKSDDEIKYTYPDGQTESWAVTHWMRRKEEDGWQKCKALEGNVGQSVTCTVYDKRPSACSGFDPGSPQCLHIRQWAGVDPK